MLKRLMFLTLGFALCLGVVGCNSNPPAEIPENTSPPPDDGPSSSANVEPPAAPG